MQTLRDTEGPRLCGPAPSAAARYHSRELRQPLESDGRFPLINADQLLVFGKKRKLWALGKPR